MYLSRKRMLKKRIDEAVCSTSTKVLKPRTCHPSNMPWEPIFLKGPRIPTSAPLLQPCRYFSACVPAGRVLYSPCTSRTWPRPSLSLILDSLRLASSRCAYISIGSLMKYCRLGETHKKLTFSPIQGPQQLQHGPRQRAENLRCGTAAMTWQ